MKDANAHQSVDKFPAIHFTQIVRNISCQHPISPNPTKQKIIDKQPNHQNDNPTKTSSPSKINQAKKRPKNKKTHTRSHSPPSQPSHSHPPPAPFSPQKPSQSTAQPSDNHHTTTTHPPLAATRRRRGIWDAVPIPGMRFVGWRGLWRGVGVGVGVGVWTFFGCG